MQSSSKEGSCSGLIDFVSLNSRLKSSECASLQIAAGPSASNSHAPFQYHMVVDQNYHIQEYTYQNFHTQECVNLPGETSGIPHPARALECASSQDATGPSVSPAARSRPPRDVKPHLFETVATSAHTPSGESVDFGLHI